MGQIIPATFLLSVRDAAAGESVRIPAAGGDWEDFAPVDLADNQTITGLKTFMAASGSAHAVRFKAGAASPSVSVVDVINSSNVSKLGINYQGLIQNLNVAAGEVVGLEFLRPTVWGARITVDASTGALLLQDTTAATIDRIRIGSTIVFHSGTPLTFGAAAVSGDITMGGTKVTGLGTPSSPSDAATKSYVDGVVSGVTGVLTLRGSTNCSANPNYPSAVKGDLYLVSVAGKIGGASGKSVDAGDVYIATADNAGGTEASVGTSWTVLEHNLSGVMLGANNLSDLTNTTTARSNLGLGNVDNISLNSWPGSTNVVTLGTIATGIWHGTTIEPQHGGTGLTSVVTGDMLYATGSNVLAAASPNTIGLVTKTGAQTITGLKTFSPTANSAAALSLDGLASQSEDMLLINNSSAVRKFSVDASGLIKVRNVAYNTAEVVGLDYFCPGAFGARLTVDTLTGEFIFQNTTAGVVEMFRVGNIISLSPQSVIIKPNISNVGQPVEWGSTAISLIPIEARRYTGTAVDAWQLKTFTIAGAEMSRHRVTQGDATGASGTVAEFVVENAILKSVGMIVSPEQTLTDGANIAWDVAAKPVASVTMAGNRTIDAATNARAGAYVSIRLIQDGTGGRRPTWDSSYEFPGGQPDTNLAAGAHDTFVFYCRSTSALVYVGGVAPTECFTIAVSDETTAITTGAGKVTFRVPYKVQLTALPRASLNTVSSSGAPAFDINEAGGSIFSTTLTIDVSEKTSVTAATPAVLSDYQLADDAEVTIDIDTAGTGAKGAKITFYWRRVP